MAQNQNPFDQYTQAITMAAGAMYAAEREGNELAVGQGFVSVLPQDVGDGSRKALAEAERAQAQFNVAARAVARVALLKDDIEQGGAKGAVARFELGVTKLIDRRYLKGSDKIVDTIRGVGNS